LERELFSAVGKLRFWVPKMARWSHLEANAPQPSIGKLIDEAMGAIDAENPTLKGVLPNDYNQPALDKVMLGELINLISGIALGSEGAKARDLLGRVYEYFLDGFAGSEGKRGGEFYTARSIVGLLVEMLEPCPDPTRGVEGRVYGPCCGSGGMFVQAERFLGAPGFCKAASRAEIEGHGYVLTPGGYVGAPDVEDDDVPFAVRFAALSATLETQFAEADRLTATIRERLKMVAA
jgi:type I restriction-modification system DNA methylase subunit